MSKFNYVITKDQIVVYRAGKPIVVPNTNSAYKLVIDAIRTNNTKALDKALDKATHVTKFMQGKVTIKHGQVLYNGVSLHNTIVDRILMFMDQDINVKPLIKFLENLMQNPSSSSVNELYDFLEVGKFPITEDGCFLAWKKVRDNYLDCYSGKFDNRVGAVLEMERNQVDDNRNSTCSHGFHIASYNYADTFQTGKMLVVKVNPKDVVSVPADHNNEKCRVCKYEVVEEISERRDVLQDAPVVTKYKKAKKPAYHNVRDSYGRFA